MTTAAALPKPLLRGVSHQLMVTVAAAAGAALVTAAPPGRARLGALVYAVSMVLMYSLSALYHRSHLPPRWDKWLERLDHSAIFLFIAGTYTPLCLVLEHGTALLVIAWASAVLGVLRGLFWVEAPHWLSSIHYVITGWAVIPWLGELWRALGTGPLLCLAVGGLLYSGGAVVFARKRPDPLPRVFGFHELFHALVIAATVLHFAAIATAVPRIAG